MRNTEYDAVVVGAGPNGLAGAITLARAGRKVLLLEAAPIIGGGMRSAELTRPGFVHDVCSTVQALGVASPAFRDLDLESHGVEWCTPEIAIAHPLDAGRAALLRRDIGATAAAFAPDDAQRYEQLMRPFVAHETNLVATFLSPFQIPPAPIQAAAFGRHAIRSARGLARARFTGDEPRALIAGSAAHAIQPLGNIGTAGYGLFLNLLAHANGWPVAKGGSQQLANALGAIFVGLGGEIEVNRTVADLSSLPPAPITLLDITPRQFLTIAGDRVAGHARRALAKFRYGPGVFKIDWALNEPIPWTNPDVMLAGTVHVGGTLEEITESEAEVASGHHPDRPFTLLVQPTVMDPSRAPNGKHVAWAYCHVPNGSTRDRTEAIEQHVERFAPGFRDVILDRHVMNTAAMEEHNANYVGGDINGGAGDLRQLFTRPVISLHPWATPIDGVYLCSSSTPPGGGVHGMGGLHAARLALARES